MIRIHTDTNIIIAFHSCILEPEAEDEKFIEIGI